MEEKEDLIVTEFRFIRKHSNKIIPASQAISDKKKTGSDENHLLI